MFTGLIEGVAVVTSLEQRGPGVDVTIESPFTLPEREQARIGDSVAINGCCLTIVSIQDGRWTFQAGSETLSRTNLHRLEVGSRVNIERSLKPTDRLGGHFVQGHIDQVGTVERGEHEGDWVTMWFNVPAGLTSQIVSKGSIAIDGVSLTVVNVTDNQLSVALIPHTLQATTLGDRQPGDLVNLETDIIGKYLDKMFQAFRSQNS